MLETFETDRPVLSWLLSLGQWRPWSNEKRGSTASWCSTGIVWFLGIYPAVLQKKTHICLLPVSRLSGQQGRGEVGRSQPHNAFMHRRAACFRKTAHPQAFTVMAPKYGAITACFRTFTHDKHTRQTSGVGSRLSMSI